MIKSIRDDLISNLQLAVDSIGAKKDIESKDVEIKEFTDENKGELSTPISYKLTSQLSKDPNKIAEDIVSKQIENGLPKLVDSVDVINGYINYHINIDAFIYEVIEQIQSEGHNFGHNQKDNPDNIIADVSSPNIAKPMHVGHLRNTILGDTLMNIFISQGHNVITDNHLGDWGVPFAGALIYEYKCNGSKEELEEEGIDHLLNLYQNFRQREDQEEHMNEAKKWFKLVESGDEEAYELWQKFREISVNEFKDTYNRLGVKFDLWMGESFYSLEGWTDEIVERCLNMNIAVKEDDGAIYIPVNSSEQDVNELDEENIDKFYIQKKDGSSVYGTRDLATIVYRKENFNVDHLLYVVASEQDTYFQQLFKAANMVGYDNIDYKHVSYGLIPNMSTRDGNIVKVCDLLDDAYDVSKSVVQNKNDDLSQSEIENIAEKIALATVKYEMVSVSREKNLQFDLDDAVSLEGDTGPYIQYQTTRTYGILDNIDTLPSLDDVDINKYTESEKELVYMLSQYPIILEECIQKYDVAPLSNYLIRLSHMFSSFYSSKPVLNSENARDERILITKICQIVLENGLDILGIPVLEKM